MKSIHSEFPELFMWFQLLGCFPLPAQRIIYVTIFSLLSFLALLGGVIAFMNTTSYKDRVEMLYNIGIFLYLGFTISTIRTHYSQLLQFLTTISTPEGINGDLQSMVFQLTVHKVSEHVPKVVVMFASLLVFGLFQWLGTLFHKSDNFVGPVLFQCGQHGNKLPLKSVCLPVDSWAQFILANSLCSLVMCWGSLGYIWAFAFFISLGIFVEKNVKVVGERLQQIQRRVYISDGFPVTPGRLVSGELYEAALRNEFVKIIQYYQYLIK